MLFQRELDHQGGVKERLWKEATERGDVFEMKKTEAEAAIARKEAGAAAENVADIKNGLDRIWDPVHSRNAARLLRLCRTNSGVYVKLGKY